MTPDTQAAFLNAYTFGFGEKRGFTRGQGWKWSMEEMVRTTGCNALILPVCAWQDHAYSTQVDSVGPDVMDEADAAAVCAHARQLGLKIIMKAMVNCRDGYWRAYIRFFDHPVPTEPGWDQWFPSWEAHVCRVADMAQAARADMLCVGCEMVGADQREREWRRLIAQARRRYAGPLTYNCDKYQEDHIAWWDALDFISSSGYYPIGEIRENFRRIEQVCERVSRPFLFMECGCPSRQGSQHRPNDWRFGGDTDPQAQRDWYGAFTQAVLRFPFIRGTGWWDWPATRLYPEACGPDNGGYCTYGKPASDILRKFAAALAAPAGGS